MTHFCSFYDEEKKNRLKMKVLIEKYNTMIHHYLRDSVKAFTLPCRILHYSAFLWLKNM